MMAELDQKRARQERVDLVVLGDQDRKAAAGMRQARRVRRLHRRSEVEGVVAQEAGGERGRAHRLDQIAGEAGRFERGKLIAHRRRDQHDPPRHAGSGARQRFARPRAERVIDEHGAPHLLRQQSRGDLIVGDDFGARAPALQAPGDQRRFGRSRGDDQNVAAGQIGHRQRGLLRIVGARQRNM